MILNAENMFTPKLCLLLKPEAFIDKSVACLGAQLKELVNYLGEIMPSCTWYVADLDSHGNDHLKQFSYPMLKRLGGKSELIKLSEETDQFLSGVFLAVNNSANIKQLIELSTEDERFRPINCDDALIEIRAFDTSYFEVYSNYVLLIEEISKHFGEEDIITCEKGE